MLKATKILNSFPFKQAAPASLIAMLVALCWAEFQFDIAPVRADSEASSEAGLEAPANLRRRRRGYYGSRQNSQNQQNQTRREMMREARERNRQQQIEQKQLANGPQIKNYGPSGGGGGRRRRQNRFNQQGQQNSQNQLNQQAQFNQ